MDQIKLKELRDAIKDSGIRLGKIAAALDVNPNTLTRKLDGRSEITVPEARAICKVCRFSNEIAFNIFLA